MQQLRQLLAEFTLSKFYEVFGIQNVKCAPISAFPHFRPSERSVLAIGASALPGSLVPVLHNQTNQWTRAGPSHDASGVSSTGTEQVGKSQKLKHPSDVHQQHLEFKKRAYFGGPYQSGANLPPTIILVDEDGTGATKQFDACGSRNLGGINLLIDTQQQQHSSKDSSYFNDGAAAVVGDATLYPDHNPLGSYSLDHSTATSNPHHNLTYQRSVSVEGSTSAVTTTTSTIMNVAPAVTSTAQQHQSLAMPNTAAYGFAQNNSSNPHMSFVPDGLDRPERLSLNSLEFLTDTLLEVISLVIKEEPELVHWLDQWNHLARK